jgi:hypothetical protein
LLVSRSWCLRGGGSKAVRRCGGSLKEASYGARRWFLTRDTDYSVALPPALRCPSCGAWLAGGKLSRQRAPPQPFGAAWPSVARRFRTPRSTSETQSQRRPRPSSSLNASFPLARRHPSSPQDSCASTPMEHSSTDNVSPSSPHPMPIPFPSLASPRDEPTFRPINYDAWSKFLSVEPREVEELWGQGGGDSKGASRA